MMPEELPGSVTAEPMNHPRRLARVSDILPKDAYAELVASEEAREQSIAQRRLASGQSVAQLLRKRFR